ncbi:hypothetical protein ABZV34_27435 [Streptomyces sp. NPDC005195]|uniref:hypothetical protein n=1 Tax=Streptomyces sp. NPDC005195 TaxID=3154561 RepID=UPI0033B17977
MGVSVSLIEAQRIDWSSLRCGCGETGAHIPEVFARLLQARTPSEIADATLDGHINVQSLLFEVAVPVTSLIAAALQEDLPEAVRVQLLDHLLTCVAGESHWTEVEAGAPEIEVDCQIVAREAIWTLYQEYASGHAMLARYILEEVDPDQERFSFFDAKLISRIQKAVKRH